MECAQAWQVQTPYLAQNIHQDRRRNAGGSGVSPRTIRNWASDGLRVMDDTRPALIRGVDLMDEARMLSPRNRRATERLPVTMRSMPYGIWAAPCGNDGADTTAEAALKRRCIA